MSMRVSIIIPAYNAARFLPACIESVLAQTHRDIEIIVVNDGSTDNTDDVVRPYLDRIRYITQCNKGLSAARNAGFKASSGQFVCFLDADDVLMQDKFQRQIAKFAEETGYAENVNVRAAASCDACWKRVLCEECSDSARRVGADQVVAVAGGVLASNHVLAQVRMYGRQA